MKPTKVLASVLALSTFTSAWPWPPSLQDIKTLAQENGLYQKRSAQDTVTVVQARQDNNNGGEGGGNSSGGGGGNGGNNAPPPSSDSAPPPSSGSAPPPSSGGSAQPSGSNSPSGSDSGKGSAPPPTDSKGSDKSDAQTTPPPSTQYTDSIPAGAQPGMINMITPNTQSTATQYYKVNQTITWVWNYTSLSRPPSAIDILATMSASASGVNPQSPYTIATNYSFAPTETFTWDTEKYITEDGGQNQLPQGMYTLLVYDAAASGGVSATASPGYLGLFNQFHFGMYQSQGATPLATPYQCATCNSAKNSMERMAVTSILGIAVITVGSFMWFANGFGGLV